MSKERMYVYFKLFNNIKSEHEAKDFAKLELNSLFGKVEPIHNFADISNKLPLSIFTSPDIRIQDKLFYELPYGKIHGYLGKKDKFDDLTPLVQRLGYTREIYVIVETKEPPQNILRKIFPKCLVGKNIEFYEKSGHLLLRVITNQYFLEKSEYISKLSRNEGEIDANVNILFSHPFKNIYRIPASETMKIGKRLEDYFAKREESSLYLTHYIHPYKGKFHPKMVRALLNYICPSVDENTLVCDNFAGSGTLLLEAILMGINSCGIEINPLSVLMTNVKCHSLAIPLNKLRREIDSYLKNAVECINEYVNFLSGQTTLIPSKITLPYREIIKKKNQIPMHVVRAFRNDDSLVIDKILIYQEIARKIPDKKIRDFIVLAISGTISDISRRTSAEFTEALKRRLNDLYLRIYLFHKLNEVLQIKLGNAKGHVGDTREMKEILKNNSIDGIINSPPYSTALDYIKFDEPQLTILGLADSLDDIAKKMIGIPRQRYYPHELLIEIDKESQNFRKLPEYAKKIIKELINNGRKDAGLRTYKFYMDMYRTIKEMFRVLKPKAKCAIIIGNNHYKVNSEYVEVQNDRVTWEIGKNVGFRVDKIIKRDLEKTSTGNIRYESVVILQKPS